MSTQNPQKIFGAGEPGAKSVEARLRARATPISGTTIAKCKAQNEK
jgi:hypothetical protein